jgi:hypothetical protein
MHVGQSCVFGELKNSKFTAAYYIPHYNHVFSCIFNPYIIHLDDDEWMHRAGASRGWPENAQIWSTVEAAGRNKGGGDVGPS